jgi:aspartate ammonia-lyase
VRYRIEKDSLGEKKVPADVYYGIQTQRAVENYPISGYRAHPRLICAIGMIKKAAALANRQLELVDEQRAGAIAQAADEVIAGKLNDQFVVDVYQAGAGVSFHMNTNEVICNRAIEILDGPPTMSSPPPCAWPPSCCWTTCCQRWSYWARSSPRKEKSLTTS